MTTLTAEELAQAEADKGERLAQADMKRYRLHVWNLPPRLIWGAIFAHVGVLIIVALYYGLFETTPFMKHLWDYTICPNGNLRHQIRDVGEGVLGGYLAKAIMWNHFTKSHAKAGRLFDALHERLRIHADLAAFVSAAVIFAACFAVGIEGLRALAWHASHPHVGSSIWSRTATIWNSDWDKKALAFVCAFPSSRPMHTVFDDLQGYFAGRLVDRHKKPRFFYPKAFKNRYRYMTEHANTARVYSPWVDRLLRLVVPMAAIAAGAGYYVLAFIAH